MRFVIITIIIVIVIIVVEGAGSSMAPVAGVVVLVFINQDAGLGSCSSCDSGTPNITIVVIAILTSSNEAI